MGWSNIKAREDQRRALEAEYRKRGYSDGYALLPAKSLEANYARGWRAGRQARRDFEEGCE
jgi:hypothetical protein